LLASALVVLCVGCGTAGASAPTRAGASASQAAKMICASEGQKEIAAALGVQTTAPVVPTWTDHLYSCGYQYGAARIGLSVKELSDAGSTDAYFTSAKAGLGSGTVVGGLGQDAYQGSDGSVVVRKDFKVLRVEVASLPDHFGSPAIDRSEAAVRIAVVVMGCWKEH
jgi:hypothetical protein